MVLRRNLSNLRLAIAGGRDKTVIGVSSAVGSSMGSKNWGRGRGARPIDYMLGYNVDTQLFIYLPRSGETYEPPGLAVGPRSSRTYLFVDQSGRYSPRQGGVFEDAFSSR